MFRRPLLFALALACVPVTGFAADAVWLGERYNIVVRDQDVRDVFRQFGSLVGVPVVISEQVDARATARFENATGEQIMEAIATEYGLDWRFDGRRIEVSSNSEQVSRILDMGGVLRSDLIGALDELGSYEPRFPISAVDGELGFIVGPPRYVAIVEVVLAELVEKRVKALAEERERLAEEKQRRLAEEERLRELQAERLRALLNRPQAASQRTTPLVNRGGRWGG